MKLKAIRPLLIVGVPLLATLTVVTLVVGAASGRLSPTPPSPPTPGPAPTSVPYKPEGGQPVRSREEAIQRALALDSAWTVREQPLTEEVLAANPDVIIVEPYVTRQEAADVYFGDVFPDPEIASEPVWVVVIKGKVSVQVLGFGVPPGGVEADGVTYVISQKTGYLLALSTGALEKRTGNSP
ncbi:MAG: hypothetical protein SVX38_09560 [Chloroflexota bacterium]|nr:hypothetical protein [Chloroflexota bacterium]